MSTSTMTERQMLELAAKAAGLRVRWEEVHFCFWIEPGQGLPIEPWSPLTDDGDALRLAHAVGIRLDLAGNNVGHWRLPMSMAVFGRFDMEMVRRMIVETAAQVALLPPLPAPKPLTMSELMQLNGRVAKLCGLNGDGGKAMP